jgi:hypothetical protein
MKRPIVLLEILPMVSMPPLMRYTGALSGELREYIEMAG